MSDIEVLAMEAASGISVPELHGTVTGLIAASDGESAEVVSRVGLDLLGDGADPVYLDQFIEAAVEAIFDPDMSFKPLLDDENDPLTARARGLGEWVSGFLAGYAALADGDDRPEEVEETIRDFASIAQIDTDLEESEDAEGDFVSIFEFVRVGALLVLESR